jgi:hypothetical protein
MSCSRHIFAVLLDVGLREKAIGVSLPTTGNHAPRPPDDGSAGLSPICFRLHHYWEPC